MSESKIALAVIPALIGAAAATAACFLFFYFARQTPGVDAKIATPTPTVSKTIDEIPNPDIAVADVESVSIDTVYPGYFQANDRCAKTYNEYFGNGDGIGSTSSPCTVKISIGRDGQAHRSIILSRWDKEAKQKRIVEQSESAAQVAPAQFEAIAALLVGNDAFRSWRNGTMINVSNCTITVKHKQGSKSPMSNVSDATTAYLPMVTAFKDLEKQLKWKVL